MDVRRVWREHRRLADVTVCAAAAALTILVSRAAWGSLSPYPQPSAAAFADRLLPVGVLVLVRGIGMPLLACGLLLGRRRHPVAVAVVLLLLSPFLPVLVPLLVALFTTARTRPPRTTAWISAAALWPVPVQLLLSPSDGRVSVAAAVSAVACVIGAVG